MVIGSAAWAAELLPPVVQPGSRRSASDTKALKNVVATGAHRAFAKCGWESLVATVPAKRSARNRRGHMQRFWFLLNNILVHPCVYSLIYEADVTCRQTTRVYEHLEGLKVSPPEKDKEMLSKVRGVMGYPHDVLIQPTSVFL